MPYSFILEENFVKKDIKMHKSSGRVWPYAIAIAITLVFGFCVTTIFVTESTNVQESDAYMTHYQDADMNANKLIHQRMLFDKKYTIKYITENISAETSSVEYKVTDKDGNLVNNARVKIAISRPETSTLNQELDAPSIKNGVYSFNKVKFPKAGVWNIIAKVTIGDYSRFYNIKADTRNSNSYEF